MKGTRVWKWPPLSRKCHWFPDGLTSACRRWMFAGPPQEAQTMSVDKPGKDDCVVCWRAAVKGAHGAAERKVKP